MYCETKSQNIIKEKSGYWLLLDAKINMFLDAKTEASGITEVASEQLVLLHLQPTL